MMMKNRKWFSILPAIVSVALIVALLVAFLPSGIVSADPGWLTGYDYRKEITIDGSTAGAQTDYALLLNVYSGSGSDSGDDVYLDSHCQDFPNDIRFTASDEETELDYWIIDKTSDPVEVWVEFDSIPAYPDSATFYVYYGNSDPSYQGLVDVITALAGEYGVYFGTNPSAVYYSGAHNRTYIGFQNRELAGTGCDPWIIYYDHTTETWTTPAKIADTPIPDDPHSGVAIIVDSSGYIHAFYGAHATAIKWSRSTSPEDISSWETPKDIGTVETYPHVCISGSTMYLFYRHNISSTKDTEEFRTSTNYAGLWASASFSSATTCIDFGDNYSPYFEHPLAVDGNSDIHTCWTEWDDGLVQRVDVYYARYDVSESKWYDGAGNDLGTQITRNEASSKIIDSGSDKTYADAVRFNSSTKPYTLFTRDSAGDSVYKPYIAEYTAGWNITQISTDTVYALGQLDIVGDSDFDVYFPTSNSFKRYNWNGASWSTAETIDTPNKPFRNTALVENYSSDIKLALTRGINSPAELWVYGDLAKSKSDADNALPLMDNAEPDRTGDWQRNDASYGTFVVSTTAKYTGNYGLWFEDTDATYTLTITEYLPTALGKGKLDFWIKFNESDENKLLQIYDSSAVSACIIRWRDEGGIWYYLEGTGYVDTGVNYQTTNWEHYELEWDSDTDIIRLVRDDVEILANCKRQVFSTLDRIVFQGYAAQTPKCYIDDLIVHKFVDPEPTWGVWGEEETEPCSPSISLNTYSWSVNSGNPVAPGSNYATGLTYFTITNNSGGAVDITIGGTDMAGGGYTWDLADDGNPGNMVYAMKAGLSGGDYTIIVRETATYNTLKAGLADEGTQDFGLKIWIPTSWDDTNNKQGTITVTAVCSS